MLTAALDEQAYRLVPGTPGGDIERGAVRRDSEVRVALVQSVDSHSEFHEATDASRVDRARELVRSVPPCSTSPVRSEFLIP